MEEDVTESELVGQSELKVWQLYNHGKGFNGWLPIYFEGKEAGKINLKASFKGVIEHKRAAIKTEKGGSLSIKFILGELTNHLDVLTEMDPYVIARLGAQEIFRTKTEHDKGSFPVWNELYTM